MSTPKFPTAARTPEERVLERIADWRRRPNPRDDRDQNYGQRTRTLDLAQLQLRAIPSKVRELVDVEVLDLSHNSIEQVPPWIAELVGLKVLRLDGNRLRSLPREIGLLPNLAALTVTHNLLQGLPDSLRGAPLRRLKLDGNSALDVPKSILDSGPAELLRYYFEIRGTQGSPLQEMKLILVGRGGAGKTSITKCLAGEAPSPNESETHSIEVRELELKCKRGTVIARTWDFGGQEILHSTHRFFLTERSLYLLILEPRHGLAERDAEYWLPLIETQGAKSPTIVALNWSSGRTWRIDEVRLRRKFPFIVKFISTDALHGIGIDELRRVVFETVENSMPDVWLPFPTRWRKIKDEVAGMRSNYLTYSQFIEVCEANGERDRGAQEDLAVILHSLGLALYYGRDPVLHDTRVLNPRWVTGGVYAVIRASIVASKCGRLTVADMAKVIEEASIHGVLDAKEYTSESYQFILELMRAFQLCYSNDETRSIDNGTTVAHYLVPELLPEFEPSMKERWEASPVQLRYVYEVLPGGLLPRFIVRTNALGDGAPHWRRGVVLRHSDAQALIRAEADRPEVHVFAQGNDVEARRVLVAIVRSELLRLHEDMKLRPVEQLGITGSDGAWIGVKALRDLEFESKAPLLLPTQPDGTAEVNVPLELNKLTPAAARAFDRTPPVGRAAVRVFVSYAREDERRLRRLDAILDVLEQEHGITSWRDRRLMAGEEWDSQIRQRLSEMDLFLFIASQISLVRPYIQDPEIRIAKERYASGEIEVATVKLEPCACDEVPFIGSLQRLDSTHRSIVETHPQSRAWEQVRLDLLPLIDKIRRNKGAAAR